MTDVELQSLPFFRELHPAALTALRPYVTRHDVPAGVRLIREGEAASSMFFLGRGKVRVVRGDTDNLLDTIDAPSLFGEMALVATSPRLASVITDSACILFEVTRDAIFTIAAQYPSVRDVILQFHRDRLMRNILASNPLFAPISEEKKRSMSASFVAQSVAPGMVLLQEGQPGVGLYVLLRGRCEVLHAGGNGQPVKVGELGEGDVFGEISMVLFERTCTATVRTLSECVVLLLGREVFQSTIMSNHVARGELVKLALKRLRDTEDSRQATKAYFV